MAAEELKTPAWQGTKKTFEALIRPIVLSEQERRQMIADAAYYRAERRGFAPGGEVDDWLAAEKEVAERLNGIDARTPTLQSAPSGEKSAPVTGSASAPKPAAAQTKPRKRAPRRRTKE